MEEHFAMLRDGRLDLVIGRVEPALVDRDFAMDELYDPRDPYRGWPAASAGASAQVVYWARLAEQDWILPQEGTPMRAGIERIFRRVKRRPARCMIESSSIQTNVSLMNARDMLWVLSEDITAYFEDAGSVEADRRSRHCAPRRRCRRCGCAGVASLRPPARLMECLQVAAAEIVRRP